MLPKCSTGLVDRHSPASSGKISCLPPALAMCGTYKMAGQCRSSGAPSRGRNDHPEPPRRRPRNVAASISLRNPGHLTSLQGAVAGTWNNIVATCQPMSISNTSGASSITASSSSPSTAATGIPGTSRFPLPPLEEQAQGGSSPTPKCRRDGWNSYPGRSKGSLVLNYAVKVEYRPGEEPRL